MSIKNNYKSKFLCVYLSTKSKFFVSGIVFVFIFLVSIPSFAQIFAYENPIPQTNARTPGDDELFAKYDSIKSKLPFYFNTYALGGALQWPNLPSEEVVEARKYVISVPVLIFNNKEISETYENWRAACKFLCVKHKMELEKNSSTISANSLSKKEPQTSKLILSEQEQEKLRVIEKEMALSGGTEEQKQAIKQKQAEEEKKMILLLREQEKINTQSPVEQKQQKENKSSKIEKETPNQAVEKLPELKLPDWTYGLLESESGLRWLFTQQVLADNLLLCSPETKIPYYIPNNLDKENSSAEYLPLIKLYKQAYPLLINSIEDSNQKNSLQKSSSEFLDKYLKIYVTQAISFADMHRKAIQNLKEFTNNKLNSYTTQTNNN